jgi:hypothetical protein
MEGIGRRNLDKIASSQGMAAALPMAQRRPTL